MSQEVIDSPLNTNVHGLFAAKARLSTKTALWISPPSTYVHTKLLYVGVINIHSHYTHKEFLSVKKDAIHTFFALVLCLYICMLDGIMLCYNVLPSSIQGDFIMAQNSYHKKPKFFFLTLHHRSESKNKQDLVHWIMKDIPNSDEKE